MFLVPSMLIAIFGYSIWRAGFLYCKICGGTCKVKISEYDGQLCKKIEAYLLVILPTIAIDLINVIVKIMI